MIAMAEQENQGDLGKPCRWCRLERKAGSTYSGPHCGDSVEESERP